MGWFKRRCKTVACDIISTLYLNIFVHLASQYITFTHHNTVKIFSQNFLVILQK